MLFGKKFLMLLSHTILELFVKHKQQSHLSIETSEPKQKNGLNLTWKDLLPAVAKVEV